MSVCVVFLCDVNYFDRFLDTCVELKKAGQYGVLHERDICLMTDGSFEGIDIQNHPFIVENNIIVKQFPNIKFSENFHSVAKKCSRYDKLIQYHKFYLFDTFFKKWDYIFYIDCGVQIKSHIQPFLDILTPGCFYAHSDSYHEYKWKLEGQFLDIDGYLDKLRQYTDINIDYFQTTILLFDTRKYIRDNVVSNLIDLAEEFPNSNNNEQGIMSLYFSKEWKQLPPFLPYKPYIRLYDFMPRFKDCHYIMYKYNYNITHPISIDPAITGKLQPGACVKPRADFL